MTKSIAIKAAESNPICIVTDAVVAVAAVVAVLDADVKDDRRRGEPFLGFVASCWVQVALTPYLLMLRPSSEFFK